MERVIHSGSKTRQIVFGIDGATGRKTRSETVEVKYNGGATAYKALEVYELFAWGCELVRLTEDPDNNALVTQFEFYTNSTESQLFEYGKVKWIKYPDGYWEKRDYYDFYEAWYFPYPVGAVEKILRPWKDMPATPEEEDEANSDRTTYD